MDQTEENLSFSVPEGVFYNPHMRLCRSFFSLAVGALPEKLRILDGFAASGIRGIRYAKENKNVESATFLDIDPNAVKAVRKNKAKHRVKGTILEKEINAYLMTGDRELNFLELDPFGTPVPYLFPSMKGIVPLKTGYLSVTATDTAVLSGPHKIACMKNYHAKSMNNEFTHETGLRILIKRIAESAMEHNYGIVPLVSLSNRHYFKTLLRLEKNSQKADATASQFGYVMFCSTCRGRSHAHLPSETCTFCGKKADYAGPLWLGELHDPKTLHLMQTLNQERDYADKKQIDKILSMMVEERATSPYFYNLHSLVSHFKWQPTPKTEDFFAKLQSHGFSCKKTHLDPLGFKTNATIKEIKQLFG